MPSVRYVAFSGIGLVSRVIKFVTRSHGYSHIAFLQGGKKSDLIECWPQKGNRFQHWSFSHIGVHKLGTPYEIWELQVNERQKKYIEFFFYKFAQTQVKYDWVGCIGFVLKLVKGSSKRLFCSEGCMVPLVTFFHWKTIFPEYVSPRDFVNILEAAGAKMVYKGVVTEGDINETK